MARIAAWIAVAGVVGSCGRVGFEARDARPDGAPGDGGPPGDGGGSDLTPPIAWWSFDEAGQTVTDRAGSRDGVLGATGATESSDPVRDPTASRTCGGAGLTFDGGDDVVTIPGPSAASLSAFSVGFSMYPTGAGGGTLPRILTKEDGGASDVIVHYRSSDDAIAINIFNTGDTLFATFARGVALGQRASWMVTYDDAADRRLRVYKDGVETTYLRQDAVTGTLRTTTNPWRIGNQATGIRGFDGTLDAVRIYDVALSPGEIAAVSALCPP